VSGNTSYVNLAPIPGGVTALDGKRDYPVFGNMDDRETQGGEDAEAAIMGKQGSPQKIGYQSLVANFMDYRFLQVFYPTRGVLAWYHNKSGQRQPWSPRTRLNLNRTA
jgi:hypothetical protein